MTNIFNLLIGKRYKSISEGLVSTIAIGPESGNTLELIPGSINISYIVDNFKTIISIYFSLNFQILNSDFKKYSFNMVLILKE